MPQDTGINISELVKKTMLGGDGAYELGRQTAIDEIRRGYKEMSLFEVQTAMSQSWAKGYCDAWRLRMQMETAGLL